MMVIAIDGPAGAGKGTISGYLALKFECQYLDTGLLYRALAQAVIDQNISSNDVPAVSALARTITIKDAYNPDLRGEAIACVASQVATIKEVRDILNDIQREFSRCVTPPYQGVILDGRDIGTVICPNATCKLFITARPEIRHRRRFLETSSHSKPISQMAQKIAERDTRDSARKIAPLTPAPDAFIIDTSDLTIEEACTQAAAYVAQQCIDQGIPVK